MNNYDELNQYNGDSEHDLWVDSAYHENTSELADEFDDEDLDEFVDNLNDWD